MCLLCFAAAAAAEPVVAAAAASVGAPTPAGSGKVARHIVASFVHPILFSVLGLPFYNYGLFVALACLVAFYVFSSDLVRARIEINEMTCFFIFLAGFGIGSKAHVVISAAAGGSSLSAWDTFINFIDLRTGHSFIGSMIGCVAALLVYVKWNRVRILLFLDVLLPCCLLGHAIGKIGCFMSGDGCYGPPADPLKVPWAMSFPNGQVPVRVPVHPTPIYEGTASFLVFAICRALFPMPEAPPEDKKEAPVVGSFPKVGRRTALLLVLYGIERCICEQFRRHPPISLFGGLTEYQGLAVLLLIIGVLIEVFGKFLDRATEQPKKKQKAEKTKNN